MCKYTRMETTIKAAIMPPIVINHPFIRGIWEHNLQIFSYSRYKSKSIVAIQ